MNRNRTKNDSISISNYASISKFRFVDPKFFRDIPNSSIGFETFFQEASNLSILNFTSNSFFFLDKNNKSSRLLLVRNALLSLSLGFISKEQGGRLIFHVISSRLRKRFLLLFEIVSTIVQRHFSSSDHDSTHVSTREKKPPFKDVIIGGIDLTRSEPR